MNDDMTSAYDIRGTEQSGLTTDYTWNLGKALADWLPTAGSVVVVYSPTQQSRAAALIEGLRLQGRNVIDGGYGDKESVRSHILTSGLSGGAAVTIDTLEQMITIDLYQHEAKLITEAGGLHDIAEMVEAGNFVPAAVKGELTAIA